MVASRHFVLQVLRDNIKEKEEEEEARGQMAALAIQRTDNFLHTFLQVCDIFFYSFCTVFKVLKIAI